MHACMIYEKREQVGMDLVRSTEAYRNHTSMHACNNKYKKKKKNFHTCVKVFLVVYALFLPVPLHTSQMIYQP